MARLSLVAALGALTGLVVAQEGSFSALPDVTGPAGMACGGCHVIADVAGIVFGGVQTATQTNIVGHGPNGSLITTSILESKGVATFTATDDPAAAGAATSFNSFGSVITVAGATLTSPTSYEVFTAFSVTSTVSGPNGCMTVSGTPSILSSAFSVPVASDAGTGYLLEAESAFIEHVGFPECSAGGGNVQSTVHSMITTTTHSVTTTGLIRPTPVAAMTSAAASSTAAPSAGPSAMSSIQMANGTNPAFPSMTVTPSNEAVQTSGGPLVALLVAGAALVLAL